jgi:hypothetical protein
MKQITTMVLIGFVLAAGPLAAAAQTLLYRNDFSDPKKPLITLNWATYVVTNHQLVLTCTRASAMDTNNPSTSAGAVEPPPSLFAGGVLPDQQTREFRVDLISANQEGACAGLEAGFNGKAYYVWKDQNGIGLLKGWGWSDGVTFRFAYFFWTNTPVKNENITLVLALTRRGTDLEISTRVLDKDHANAVLFERTVVDTPRSDPVLPNRAVKGIRTELDPVGLPWALQSFGYPCVDVGWFNPQSAPNPLAQVVYDNLEVWQYESPLGAGTRYVNINNRNPASPYSSWSTAATNIQDAVDASLPGDHIVVNDGLYATGGRAVGTNLLVNRVVVDKPLTLRSVNGPRFTVIEGYQVPGTTNGDGAVRCAYLTDGATLSGFTITEGATRRCQHPQNADMMGGGVFCESVAGVVSNCLLTANVADYGGGAAYSGTVNNCTIHSNSAASFGGGASSSALNNCTLTGNSASYGGGVSDCTANNCALIGNSADTGGAAFAADLNNCLLAGNSAQYLGGGACDGTLNNCTVTGNRASWAGGVAPDFAFGGISLTNCIIYLNTAGDGTDRSGPNWPSEQAWMRMEFCCTAPAPDEGGGNITNAPLFVDYASGNLRLQSNSPCINAGRNAYAPGSVDLDGNLRISSGTVDIGAYEFQGPGSVISYAWLQQYGLPTDGSADFSDPDCDGHSTWQEWRCQTDPTNAASALCLLSVSTGGTDLTITWQSVPGVSYFLERSTNLVTTPAFSLLATDLPGQAATTSFTDTNAASLSPLFYRVGVAR